MIKDLLVINMKYLSAVKAIFAILAIGILILSGCEGGERDVKFSSFPKEVALEGSAVHFPDSVPYVVGAVASVEDGYWCYVYQNDRFLMAVDSSFNPITFFAPRGGGPGETVSVSGNFGEKIGDTGLYSVFSSASVTLFGTSPSNDYRLEKVESLDSLRKYAICGVCCLQNGNYIAKKGDFTCGIVEYDPASKSVREWPVGLDPQNQPVSEYKLNEMNVMAYNPARGIVADVYRCCPTVVLHDEEGAVVRTITYDAYKPEKDAEGNVADCFGTLELSDDYIWILYDGKEDDPYSLVFVVDYDGKPVASLKIGKCINICIDEKRGRLIAINPGEDPGVVCYPLPDL